MTSHSQLEHILCFLVGNQRGTHNVMEGGRVREREIDMTSRGSWLNARKFNQFLTCWVSYGKFLRLQRHVTLTCCCCLRLETYTAEVMKRTARKRGKETRRKINKTESEPYVAMKLQAGGVGRCDDKVKEMLRGGGRSVCLFVFVCVRLFLSRHLVKLFSVCLSSTCRARSQSRRRKHVLSLMTVCQDCPCWGKEACQGVLHFTDDHIRHGRPPLSDWAQKRSPDINLPWNIMCKDTIWSLTSRTK